MLKKFEQIIKLEYKSVGVYKTSIVNWFWQTVLGYYSLKFHIDNKDELLTNELTNGWVKFFFSSPKGSRNKLVSVEVLRRELEDYVSQTRWKRHLLFVHSIITVLRSLGFTVISEPGKVPMVIVNEDDFDTLLAINNPACDNYFLEQITSDNKLLETAHFYKKDFIETPDHTKHVHTQFGKSRTQSFEHGGMKYYIYWKQKELVIHSQMQIETAAN